MAKILLIDDDKNLAEEVVQHLKAKLMTAEAAHSIADGKEYILAGSYDLIILDFMLPDGTGVELLREIRKNGINTPVLMLTSLSNIESKEAGFCAGSDDYLTKPFNSRELLLRIDSLLRRPALRISTKLEVGNLSLDTVSRTVCMNDVELNLLPREFALIEFFLRHPNEVFSAEALLERVWKTDSDTGVETVTTTISRLRKKIGRDKSPIKNVFGVGYKLQAD